MLSCGRERTMNFAVFEMPFVFARDIVYSPGSMTRCAHVDFA